MLLYQQFPIYIPPTPLSSRFTQIHLSITVITIIVRVFVFISTSCLVGTISIVFNSCAHISCGVDIIVPNLYFCTVNI